MQSRVFHTMLDLDLKSLPVGKTTPLVTSTSPTATLDIACERISENSFKILWTASTSLESSFNVRSAADLYWIEPESKRAVFVASTCGIHHDQWPIPSITQLYITFTVEQLEALTKDGLDWKQPQRYLARLFFFSDRLNEEEPITTLKNDLTATRNLSTQITNPQRHDVRFIFRRRNGKRSNTLYASSSVLAQNCPYFQTMFGSGFAETRNVGEPSRSKTSQEEEEEAARRSTMEEEDVLDDDSDFELDDLSEEAELSLFNLGAEYHPIYIQGFAFSTYRAVLLWIQTGYISFSPLTSSFSHLPVESRKSAWINAIQSRHGLDPLLPPSASPKFVYKLAHLLSLPALESLALEEISRQLTPDNVFLELFDSFASTYDEARKLEVDFAVKNRKEIVKSHSFRETIEKLRRNELSISGPVAADLLPLLVG